MQVYVLTSGIVALISLCFVDPYIQSGISKVGRVTLGISSAIFVVTGIIALVR